ncbi:MAG: SpoIIE family protein phosphatase [bacterium]|nr:SpoIIE family protein phosphatase [bacterium]
MLGSVAVNLRRADERALGALYRAQNQKLYPLVLIVLCIVMPFFAWLDSFVVADRFGPLTGDLFVRVDLALAAVYAGLLGVYFLRPKFTLRYVQWFFLFAAHMILAAQFYLLSRVGDAAEPYIMMLLILGQAVLIHLKPRAGLLNLGFIAAYSAPMMLFGWPIVLSLDFLPPLFAVLALGVATVIYRNTLLSQHIGIHRKNRVLTRSLSQVRELKRRQDGDYFLTSLLIKPLGGNHVDSSRVSVDILTRQQKAFRFRKWDVEIGGDLSTAYRISLQRRNYVAFLNGDAMGKSIQGAGGALVLGTVFKSIVSRFETPLGGRDRSPESWLADCFYQLHDVFSSFDGGMMATAICGLLDEQHGVLYFVNAEHPRAVLLRNGRADYLLESEFIAGKFGMLSGPGPFQINVVQLRPGDALVMGSDGRQDIYLDRENSELNEDGDLFLEFVRAGNGKPEAILDRLLAAGRPADDITLLSLKYQAPELRAEEVVPPPGYVHLKQKGKRLMAEKDWATAIDAFEKALAFKDDDGEIYPLMATIYRRMRRTKEASRMYETLAWLTPADARCLYIASFGVRASYLLEGDAPLHKGIDFGERYRLRDRKSVVNLLNLAELYRLNGDLEKAREILTEVRDLEPGNPRARRLVTSLIYRGKLRY